MTKIAFLFLVGSGALVAGCTSNMASSERPPTRRNLRMRTSSDRLRANATAGRRSIQGLGTKNLTSVLGTERGTLKAGGGTRTHDGWFTKPVLCQLSYSGGALIVALENSTLTLTLRRQGGLAALHTKHRPKERALKRAKRSRARSAPDGFLREKSAGLLAKLLQHFA